MGRNDAAPRKMKDRPIRLKADDRPCSEQHAPATRDNYVGLDIFLRKASMAKAVLNETGLSRCT